MLWLKFTLRKSKCKKCWKPDIDQGETIKAGTAPPDKIRGVPVRPESLKVWQWKCESSKVKVWKFESESVKVWKWKCESKSLKVKVWKCESKSVKVGNHIPYFPFSWPLTLCIQWERESPPQQGDRPTGQRCRSPWLCESTWRVEQDQP